MGEGRISSVERRTTVEGRRYGVGAPVEDDVVSGSTVVMVVVAHKRFCWLDRNGDFRSAPKMVPGNVAEGVRHLSDLVWYPHVLLL